MLLEVKVANHLDRDGIEMKIDSTMKDWSQSWIVISRGVKKYATELSEENKKPVLYEEASSSTGKLVAMKQKEQIIPSSSWSTTSLINQRKWNDIPVAGRIDGNSYKISKLMTRLLRHHGYPREGDGAIEWKKLLPMFFSPTSPK